MSVRRNWQLRFRNIIRGAQRREGKRIYAQVIAGLARRIMDERGGGAPKHGHRPPGVVAFDDDVIVGGDQGRGRYRLLNFRYGLTATDDGDRVDIDAAGAGFCYDYLVMKNWGGTEGQVFTKFDTVSTFRIYSTVDAAVDHGIANIGRDFSILVCPGTYNEAVSIGAFAGESIHIYGMGQDIVTIGGNAGHMTLGNSPALYLHNLTLNGATKSFEGTSSACVLNAFNVKFAKPVEARWAGASFWNCDWSSGAHMTPGASAQSVRIYGGLMEGANLDFTGATGACDDWRIYGLDMQGTASLKLKHVSGSYFNLNFTQQMNDQIYFDTNNMGVDIDCNFAPPSNAGQAVRVINGATATGVHLKGNFRNIATVFHADSRFIEVEGVADGWHVDAVFQEDGVGDTIEDNGGKSISGVFTRSKFTLVPTTAEVNTTAGSSGNVVDSGTVTGGSIGIIGVQPDADYFNGTFKETLDADITESGGVVTLSLQQEGGGDLVMRFSDGETPLDTTPAVTIALTVGSDDSPQANYIYILQSTKVLTKSTTQWPATEHIKVGYYFIPSAAFVSSNGPYIQQQWNDHRMGTDNMGHLAHMAERERLTSARYFSGIEPNGTTSYLTIVGASVDYKATAGVIYQMHAHASAAVDTSGGDEVLVVNWPGVEGAYHNITNLFDIVEDSGGNTIGNNKWFNLVIWGVANKSGSYEPAMINLPSGFYNTQASAEQDISGFDNFDLPREFDLESSTAFLIARLTIQKQAGTWAFGSVVDLRRGDLLGARGGASSPETEFPDNAFKIFDATDNTKVLEFQVDQVATGTTRTLTVPDASGTIALASQLGGTFYIPLGMDIAGAPITP